MNSFYNEEELKEIHFQSLGKNVKISKKASIYNAGSITIGDNSRVDDFVILSGKIHIGRNVHISAYTGVFAGKAGVTLGDFTCLSSRCNVYAISDDYSGQAMTNPTIPDQYRMVTQEPVKIEKHVLVGAGSLIMPGVTLCEGASFGAMSLINSNAKPWTMYVGIPARELRPRKKNILDLEEQFLKEQM